MPKNDPSVAPCGLPISQFRHRSCRPETAVVCALFARWRSAALDLIGELSLGIFLAMSLMSLQLWNIVGLALPLLLILLVQFLFAVVVNVALVFPLMGRNYDATVVSAGFGGISLGSSSTAMANMKAVTQQYGPSTRAFLIVPLVSAFSLIWLVQS